MKRSIISLALLAAMLIPAAARADSGGATINTLPDSSQLEGHAEVSHECASESCVWFGEATQYPANIECPAIYDGSHGVWVGSSLEHGSGTSGGNFAFIPEAGVVHLCLYVSAEGEDLVGQSHPFNTATGSEVLPQPPSPPPSQHTTLSIKVRVYLGCYAHIYTHLNPEPDGGGDLSVSWETPGSAKPRFLPVSSKQPWYWAIKGPPSKYTFTVHYTGTAGYLPSHGTAVFRLHRCA